MSLYGKCKSVIKYAPQEQQVQSASLLTTSTKHSALPSFLSEKVDQILCPSFVFHNVYYISDIHLEHQIINHFPESATASQIKRYIKDLIHSLLYTGDLADVEDCIYPHILFCGDIASSFEISSFFYTEFSKQCQRRFRKFSEYSIYAILGNHEFWDFKNINDCYSAYQSLFERLNINFLNNSILPFRTCEYSYPAFIVGGVGFSGPNSCFNAAQGIYCNCLTRQQELTECQKWIDTYNYALHIAQESNALLIVLSHTPLWDWIPTKSPAVNCIYFSGHTHKTYNSHDETCNSHIFADNQVGYHPSRISFKNTFLYQYPNPFAHIKDGCHEITSEQYLLFYRHMGEYVQGNGHVEHHIKACSGHFYLVKHNNYYGFFLTSRNGTYICAGGRIKKIIGYPDINFVDTNFTQMVQAYLTVLSPYRHKQEEIAKAVRSFGGLGRIHGCIVDIDFTNHIMLNPADGTISYYYSPIYGEVMTYSSLEELLEHHSPELAAQYAKGTLPPASSYSNNEISTLMHLNIKESVYAYSIRIEQLQRLFSKNILRDWNSNLLFETLDTPALPQ